MPVRTGKSGGNRETRLKTIKILGKYCLKNQRDETIQAFYLVAKTPRRFSDFCCFFTTSTSTVTAARRKTLGCFNEKIY